MSSTKHDEQNRLSLDRLINIIQQSYSKVQRRKSLNAFFVGLTGLFAGLTVLVIGEHYFYLPAVWKGVLVAISFLAGGGSYFLFSKDSDRSFSSFYNHFADWASLESIRNAIDLHEYNREGNLTLRQEAIKQNVASISPSKLSDTLKQYVENRPEQQFYKRSLASFTSITGIFLIFALFTGEALNRSLYFWKTYQPPNPYTYTVEPGNITLEQGSSFEPKIVFSDAVPENISLSFKTDIEDEYRDRPLNEIDAQTAMFSSLSPNTSGTYFFTMDGFRTETFETSIQLLPRFEFLSVTVIPPEYTGLDSTRYSYPFSSVRAYRGSQIQITAEANKQLENLKLIREIAEDTSALSSRGSREFAHQFGFEQSDTLFFSMRDSSGLTNKNEFKFAVDALEDEVPYVQIIQPASNLEMQNPKELTVEYEASDDFGLTSTTLHYELQRAFSEQAEKGTETLTIPSRNQSKLFNWDIPDLNPNPRDVLTFWIEVSDNDGFRGSKTTQSQKLTITFPSMSAYLDELENREEEVDNTLDEVSESFQQMQEEYERFNKQIRENPEGTWEQKQTLNEAQKRQQEAEQKVRELNEKFKQIRRDLQESNSVSEETMQTYKQLQKLMDEIDDPELTKLLEELQRSLDSFNPEDMRNAMENFEFNEQQYQERLQRTVELFKRLKLNSDLDKLATALDDLARQEEEVMKSDEDPSEQIEKQKAIQEDSNQLSEQLEKLGEDPPKESRDQVNNLQQESSEQLEEIDQQLEENIKQLQNSSGGNSSEQIRKQQQQIQQSYQQMAQNMRENQEQAAQQQHQINVTGLQYVLYSLINLSEQQEDLSQETEKLTSRSQGFVEKARIEQNISSQFKQISDSLFQLSSRIPGFSNQINSRKNEIEQQLSTAVEQLSERNKSQSTFYQRQSLGGINELSSMIASLLDNLQNQQGQGGSGQMSMQQLRQELGEMSGGQQKLNQQIENFINDLQGDRLSTDQMERLNQLSRQQNEIRKQLQELRNNSELESGDRVLSELERMSDEMENTINDLRGGQTDDLVIQRQENILSRMLSAEKALQERGEKEEREGTTAEEFERVAPPETSMEELEKKIRALLNDPERTRFAEDYQRLIEQYFELIRQMQENPPDTN